MTHTVKQFIDLKDMTTLRVECSSCKASLTIPIDGLSFDVPSMCPACKSDWYQAYGNRANMGTVIADFVGQLKRLKRVLEDKSPTERGFNIDVEVAGLNVGPASNVRD